MSIQCVVGDLVEQDVEAIVNPWNRNLLPWWLLLPQGVSGAIKRHAGNAPFRELREFGVLKLGQAVATGAGRLPYRAIIHVAGINHLWRASRHSIEESTRNALRKAKALSFASVALPLIGSGSGGYSQDDALRLMLAVCEVEDFEGEILLVRYRS